jgi:hypothetical protein
MQRGPGMENLSAENRIRGITASDSPEEILKKRGSQQEETNPAPSIGGFGGGLIPSYRCRASRKVGVMSGTVEDYEAGYLDAGETLRLFAELIRTQLAWNRDPLCPSTARHLIDAGYITLGGEITTKGRALVLDEEREGSPCDDNPKTIIGVFDDPIPGPVAVANV